MASLKERIKKLEEVVKTDEETIEFLGKTMTKKTFEEILLNARNTPLPVVADKDLPKDDDY